MRFRHLIVLLFVVSLSACKKPVPPPESGGDTYFSLIDFVQDEYKTFHGQPFSFHKIITLNGKTDSAFVKGDNMDWGELLKIFFAADISDSKYLGRYTFNSFEDNTTHTRVLYYEANEEALFTRRLQIVVDPYTDRILSIYIETSKSSMWNSLSQKLFYSPLKVIQVQEYEKSTPGSAKELKMEYRFL
ncbi:MAG: hypothetical protein H0X33_13805 [Taibaiella sp.]|nr:hypothetical protein [Taibaiella sp.]